MKLLAITLLCAAMTRPMQAAEPPPHPQQPHGAGLAVGAVVVCVGGYCIYRMVKICQKAFPKNTNSAPAEVVGNGTGEEYGASWNYSSIGYCSSTEEDSLTGLGLDDGRDLFIANLTVTVNSYGSASTAISVAKDDGNQHQSWTEFQAEVASHGLVVTGRGDGSKYYSRNRLPCGPDEVPLVFDESTRSITKTSDNGGQGSVTIIIERSTDMENWSSFLTVNQPFATGFQVQDMTKHGQMFYRVRVGL